MRAGPALLWAVFISYPLVTNMAFEAFSCHKFDEGEWLKSDVAIRCGSEEHDKARLLAWIAVIVYPIGLLAVCLSLLLYCRKAIVQKRYTSLSIAIAFLYREYEPQFFYWEIVEMGRRFVLVGLMVLVQGNLMQLIVGTVLSIAFLLFQVQAQPYAEMSDDFLASSCSFALCILFLCCTVFKYLSLIETAAVQSGMSATQKAVFNVNSDLLALIIVVALVFAFIFSFFLFLGQYAVEGARQRREQRANKARKLRYKDTLEEVVAPPCEDGFFHTFLSHVWGTGQDQMRIVKQRCRRRHEPETCSAPRPLPRCSQLARSPLAARSQPARGSRSSRISQPAPSLLTRLPPIPEAGSRKWCPTFMCSSTSTTWRR